MAFGGKLTAHTLDAALDVYAAVAFDHAEHRVIRLPVRLACKTRRQALNEGRQGEHWRATRQQVDVSQLDAIPGIQIGMAFKLVQRLKCAVVGVAEDRRGLPERSVFIGMHAQRQRFAA